jgi:hypothetical protein
MSQLHLQMHSFMYLLDDTKPLHRYTLKPLLLHACTIATIVGYYRRPVAGAALECQIFNFFLKVVFLNANFYKYFQRFFYFQCKSFFWKKKIPLKFWHIFLDLFCAGPAT